MMDYLQHYGVLGMKWGIRRYQNKDGSLTSAGQKHYEKTGERGFVYKSHATKKYDRKAARADRRGNSEKAQMFKERADRSRELDRRMQNYAEHEKLGRHLALRFLSAGRYGTKPMMYYMATSGKGTGAGAQAAATGQAFINDFLNPLGSWTWGAIQKAKYIRGKENTLTMRNTRSLQGKPRRVGDGK